MSFNLQEIYSDLVNRGTVRVVVGGELYIGRCMDNQSQVRLTTMIYAKDDYIPQSVRKAIMEAYLLGDLPAGFHIHVMDEDAKITMTYQGSFNSMSASAFSELFTLFLIESDEWRYRLDGLGNQDLVHVRVG